MGSVLHWFRSHTRSAALAALFALLVQFTLSFGHIHLGHAADHEVALAQNEPTGSENPQPAPGSHHEDHYCPIYAVLHLIGAAQTASPPTILPPPTLDANGSACLAVPLELQAPQLAFRSRAPPTA